MCNIAEYIVMRRAAHIINSLTNTPENAVKASYFSPLNMSTGNIIDSKPYSGPDQTPEMCVKFQRRLEDVFQTVFAGSRFSRFVAIDKSADEFKNCNTLPLYLLEVFEPSHCYIPIYVVDDSVLAVSPFNNPSIERVSKSQYLVELFPTSVILDSINDPSIERLNELLLTTTAMRLDDPNVTNSDGTKGINITYADYIYDMMVLFNEGVKKQDALLTRGFSDMGSERIVEVSTESLYYKKMKSVYSLESVERGEGMGDSVIDVTDFMPIYITHKSESGFAILEDKDKGDKTVTTISVKPQLMGLTVNDSNIKAVLCKENTAGVRYMLLELDEFYYVGNNQIVAFIDGELYSPTNLLEAYSTMLDSPIENTEISNEGIMDKVKAGGEVLKNVGYVLKKFGIKHGSNIAGILTQLFKDVGVKNAKWCMSQFGASFKRGIDLEKADTLELQEKILNDELDSMEERITTYGKTWFRSVSLSVFFGGLIYFPIAWMISRYRTKNARIRAMERLEVRLDNIIERIERKINYAEERSENETVDSLIKERQMYQMARMRLLKLKDNAYDRGRIKYATFDKDLTMTSAQRLDAYLTGGGNPNYN